MEEEKKCESCSTEEMKDGKCPECEPKGEDSTEK